MRAALINGSPKVKQSASAILLESLNECLLKEAEVLPIDLHTSVISEEALSGLKAADTWVFAYPLYVDGIPAHLLSCLMQLEEAEEIRLQKQGIMVYGIANCGFYEGIQAKLSLQLLQNWCAKSGFCWKGGLGVGGGGGLAMMPRPERGQRPHAPIDKALDKMAEAILKKEPYKNSYVSGAFPRFLYKLAAQMGWRQMIRANGGRAKDLGKRP